MALKDFDRRLVALIAEALDAAENKEELGQVCYRLARAACYLHEQEFGAERPPIDGSCHGENFRRTRSAGK